MKLTELTIRSWEIFEDTKGVIRRRNSKVRQYKGQRKKGNKTNNHPQTLHRKLNIEYQKQKLGLSSGVPEC